MKLILWAVVLTFLTFLSAQLYRFYVRNHGMEQELSNVTNETQQLERENERLQADLHYFQEPENLAKELKSKFDYKRPGEKMIKVQ